MTGLTLLELGFMRPERLWALLALPLLALAYVVLMWRKRSRLRRQASTLQVLFPKRNQWVRHASVATAILSLGALLLAWATPNGWVEVPRERATVFLVLDVSRSMAADDVAPTRLAAAQTAAKEFIAELPAGFNVSLISFAATATLLVPPTTDRVTVEAAIDRLTLKPSTAIGEGLYTALDARSLIPPDPDHPNDPPPAAVVLLSDGASTLGRDSEDAAKQAKKIGIAVSTIAFGTARGTIPNENGGRDPVPVDREELEQVAELSGGEFFSADSLDQLSKVYDEISRSVGYELVEQEITERYVGYAVILAVVAALGLIALGARWP
ncbi:MAG: VWA domain-containing protein [Propionibacteriaceae bacterium]|jgi:Ca-activated chloride channel family protein|nr:VWA domain-containing protein [Propionibacteriaceae bacterium]